MMPEERTDPRLYRSLSFDQVECLIHLLDSLDDLTPEELGCKGTLIEIKALMLKRRQDEDAGLIARKRPGRKP